MSLVLHVDGPRWRDHLVATATAHPDLVPVAKGNGYGFTLPRLARRAQWLADRGLLGERPVLSVGTYDELDTVRQRFAHDLLVLTPWRPSGFAPAATTDADLAGRLIHTVGRLEDLAALLEAAPRARFVLERMTTMLRHGFSARGLAEAAALLARHPGARLEGIALHLPLAQGSHLSQVDRLLTDVVAAGLPPVPVWVSHLTDAEQATLRTRYADFGLRPRMGTQLWLGDRGALRPTSTVLDVHAVERGEAFGYRGRTAPKAGTILVVSGGTAHGIGLEAPTGDTSVKARAATLARGGLDAAGFVRSPFSVGGKQRLFAEPPHMQASMLFLPSGAPVPAVGDELDVRVRFTTTGFDHVEVS